MAEQVPIDDILASVQAGAITAETAVRWLQQRQDEARRARYIQAHWDSATRSQVIDALDSALGGDEFAACFRPRPR